MAAAYRSSDTAVNASANTLTVTKPAGTIDGDVMLAYVYANLTSVTITPPAGWTQVATINTTITGKMTVYRKVASSEGASYIFNFSSTTRVRATVHSFSGVDTSSPIDVSGVQGQASGNCTAPSITTTVANALVVFIGGIDSATSLTFTPPSGMTERYDSGGIGSNTLADVTQSAAGATGTKTATPSVTTDENAGFLIALKPLVTNTAGLLPFLTMYG